MVSRWLASGRSSPPILLTSLLLLLILFVLETESFSVPQRHQSNHPIVELGQPSYASITPTNKSQTIILPGTSFRDTQPGELSVASCNLLAPFYHSLALDDVEQRLAFAEKDRAERFPLALDMARRTNADILLLQEVEGGPLYEPQLQQLLRRPISTDSQETLQGYDSYLWAPLLPNRPEHIVGVCIAWRSSKHRLVTSNCYKRGMICQFSEEDASSSSIGTFAIANVHLPARPSQVLGRLVTMSKTIQTLAAYDVPERTSPLDGLLMVGGDWNCDETSITARLLTDGKVSYGNVRDRNYKANVSKAVASRMKHGYRFQDIYNDDALRKEYAPVTVSLRGRGPGCMDHLFYTQQSQGPKHRSSALDVTKEALPVIKRATSKRKSRREKAFRMKRTTRGQSIVGTSGHLRVESVLATVAGSQDLERLAIINQGLPNIQAGFPSDHIPVGALFVPMSLSADNDLSLEDQDDDHNDELSLIGTNDDINTDSYITGGISQSVRRRREAGLQSLSIRRRHNLVLRCIAEWLEQGGATEIFRDLPLYKNPWTYSATGLTKKSRAPDIVCRIDKSLLVVEVTVVARTKVESVAQQKQDKYSDLPRVLPSCHVIQEAGLTVEPPVILVLDESGGIPEPTKQTIVTLAEMLTPNDPEAAKREAQKCLNRLQALF